ncbi:hypothetical protein Hanom_Chr06g00559391 [Helianthus anomalus]
MMVLALIVIAFVAVTSAAAVDDSSLTDVTNESAPITLSGSGAVATRVLGDCGGDASGASTATKLSVTATAGVAAVVGVFVL